MRIHVIITDVGRRGGGDARVCVTFDVICGKLLTLTLLTLTLLAL